ncbi:MAG: globin family protein [Oceanococcus sp.]
MTPEQIQLLKSSFAKVELIADQAADIFYERLFSVAPGVKPLFKDNMKRQGQMLMTTIGLVVKDIDQPEKIIPTVQKLGARHVGYGALPEHYPVVGAALIWTLQKGLGDAFTPAHKEAWAAAYQILADVMIEAQLKSAA